MDFDKDIHIYGEWIDAAEMADKHKETFSKVDKELYPYIRFKKKQVKYIFVALEILKRKKIGQLTLAEKKKISNSLVSARKETYQSGQKRIEKLKADLKDILQL